jgi:hypothetical protein
MFQVSKSKPLVDPKLMRETSHRTKVLKVLKKAPADATQLRAKTKLTVHEVQMALQYLIRMNVIERLQ